MHLELCEGIYIASLSLQIAGALILVKFLFHKGTRKNILKEMINNAPEFDGGEVTKAGTRIDLDVTEIRRYASNTYKNIIASVYITLGYLLSVFGTVKTDNKWCICIWIAIVALILLAAGVLLVHLFVKKIFANDCTVILKDNGEIEELKDKKEL